MSVLDLVNMELPPISSGEDAYSNIAWTFSFFSPSEPVNDIGMLKKVLVPPKGLIAKLLDKAKQCWLDGAESLTLPGVSEKLPLWSLHFWSDLHLIVHPARISWERALTWLQRDELKLFQDQVRATWEALAWVSWSGNLPALSTNRTQFVKSALLGFLSRGWLSDEHVDLMLYLLEAEIKLIHPRRNFHVLTTVLSRRILEVYDETQTGEKVYDPNGTTFLHRFGVGLSKNSELGGIFHVNGNHWVAIAVDITLQDLLYGDPAQLPINTRIVSALRWFLSQHVPSLQDPEELDDGVLPCPLQNFSIDSWSCGMYSFNGLAHYFLKQYPLVENTSDPVFGDLARMGMLRKIIERCNKINLPTDCALPLTSPLQLSLLQQRPVTPPPNAKVLDLSKALKQLSVSPKKPQPKKRKVKGKAAPIIAPIFQIKKAPLFGNLKGTQDKKRKYEDVDAEDTVTEVETHADDVESDEEVRVVGRPRHNVMDMLTVEVRTPRGAPRKYRCAGTGCPKRWAPRTTIRVFAHAKRCLKLTQEQRHLASSESASKLPGALVAADNAAAQEGVQTTFSSQSIASSQSSFTSLRGSPLPIKASDNLQLLPRGDGFFGPEGRRKTHRAMNLAIVKLFCIARLPPTIADLDVWKDMLKIALPSYVPASRTLLMDDHIMSEQERVRKLQLDHLRTQRHVSISFDGGALRNGESLYTVHATTVARDVMLLEGQDGTRESHTGVWIAELVMRSIDENGKERIGSVSSDNTGNTRVAREIICSQLPHVLNLPDPAHHLNNTWKDIASLPYFTLTIKTIRRTIKYFKNSNASKDLLRELREELKLGPGLESIGKTRFSSLVWSSVSVLRCLRAIRQLATSERIDIPKYQHVFIENTQATLQFEIHITQFIATGEGIARAIECLEANSTNPADVYLYWLAVVAKMKQTLETACLPDEVCGQIRGIMVSRWREFFVYGPTNVHLSAFYLNPNYVRSSILKNPNPLTFNITLPAKAPAKVPPGIRNPKTFLQVGRYLHTLLIAEIHHGCDPFLAEWKEKPKAFGKAYQTQFIAYAQGAYPFTTPLMVGQSPLEWWMAFEGTEHAGILAAIAIKLFGALPHSMGDERTMSAITMINTAQRNRQKVNVVMALTQVRSFYYVQTKPRLRKSARPNPTIKFFNVERLLRPIDNDEGREEAAAGANYDESEDEEDVDLNPQGSTPPPSSAVLPVDEDDEIDLCSDELAEILADGPISRVKKFKVNEMAAAANVEVDNEEAGGDFELDEWV
ncbi:hypothetical protein M413DRAFT_76363 [Hebeloma cylindrosporum]|uniref:Ubiquitin-like protease family profile domain-containing protein n=1 Tax=Hebeloma cylindrosporum TaxID=76867 RepID=A0A0C3C174_HEBCY|nr:hypothetical protein M413DRAFT_76363 [Hebeloma cylindrosporum h7]